MIFFFWQREYFTESILLLFPCVRRIVGDAVFSWLGLQFRYLLIKIKGEANLAKGRIAFSPVLLTLRSRQNNLG